jgi:hypothetical protein
LRTGGCARGLVARLDRGGVVLGYFFGPKIDSEKCIPDSSTLVANKAILVGQFGDLGLQNGEWKITGQLKDFQRAQWPVPEFVRKDDSGVVRVSSYDDNMNIVSERRGTSVDAKQLPRDSLMGYGAVEIRLTDLLHQGNGDSGNSRRNQARCTK